MTKLQKHGKQPRELLLEMKVEIDKEFSGSSICKVQVEGSPSYYRTQRKGYLDQFCCIDGVSSRQDRGRIPTKHNQTF